MSTTPDQIPEPEEEEDNDYNFVTFLGSLIVDGAVQYPLAFWAAWIFKAGLDRPINVWLLWAGMTIFYVTIHWWNAEESGKWMLRHIFLLIIGTLITWFTH